MVTAIQDVRAHWISPIGNLHPRDNWILPAWPKTPKVLRSKRTRDQKQDIKQTLKNRITKYSRRTHRNSEAGFLSKRESADRVMIQNYCILHAEAGGRPHVFKER